MKYGGEFSYLMLGGETKDQIERQLVLEESVEAPIEAGQKVGSLNYLMNGKSIGSVDILAADAVEKAGFMDYVKWMWAGWKLTSDAEPIH